jgi:hypothetical protein
VSERETLTYELFGTAARELAEQSKDLPAPTTRTLVAGPCKEAASAARWATPSTSRTCS